METKPPNKGQRRKKDSKYLVMYTEKVRDALRDYLCARGFGYTSLFEKIKRVVGEELFPDTEPKNLYNFLYKGMETSDERIDAFVCFLKIENPNVLKTFDDDGLKMLFGQVVSKLLQVSSFEKEEAYIESLADGQFFCLFPDSSIPLSTRSNLKDYKEHNNLIRYFYLAEHKEVDSVFLIRLNRIEKTNSFDFQFCGIFPGNIKINKSFRASFYHPKPYDPLFKINYFEDDYGAQVYYDTLSAYWQKANFIEQIFEEGAIFSKGCHINGIVTPSMENTYFGIGTTANRKPVSILFQVENPILVKESEIGGEDFYVTASVVMRLIFHEHGEEFSGLFIKEGFSQNIFNFLTRVFGENKYAKAY